MQDWKLPLQDFSNFTTEFTTDARENTWTYVALCVNNEVKYDAKCTKSGCFRRKFTNSHDEAFALKMIAEGKAEACEQGFPDHLRKYGYVRGLKPAIVVFNGYSTDKYWKKCSEAQRLNITALVRKIKSILSDVVSYSTEVLKKDMPDSVGIGKKFPIFNMYERGYVLEQALSDGWLRYDGTTSKVIGAYLYI